MTKGRTDFSGVAALSICESLLLALTDHKILPEAEIMGILHDAAAAHDSAAGPLADAEMHDAVAALIHRITASIAHAAFEAPAAGVTQPGPANSDTSAKRLHPGDEIRPVLKSES